MTLTMSETKKAALHGNAMTQPYHLIGFYTRYSSWTARVVLVLEYYNIPYQASYHHVYTDAGRAAVKQHSPTGKVPALLPASFPPSISITDSLSILEFLAETHPELPLWPRDHVLRALARSAANEMHAGFTAVRDRYDSNFVARYTGDVPVSEGARREIERVLEVWDFARRVTGERLGEGVEDQGWLFGEFGIVDAMFWPVLWRFRTYNLPLSTATPAALTWMSKMWAHPVMKAQAADYFAQAERPETFTPGYEDIFRDCKGPDGRKLDIKYEAVAWGKDWEFEY